MPFNYKVDLSPAALTDYFVVTRPGSPDVPGYLTGQDFINLVSSETSASDLIIINDLLDLQPYLSGSQYNIPAGKGFKFVKSLSLSYPIVLPTGAPSVLVGDGFAGTGFVTLTYTGSGAFIRATSGFDNFICEYLSFVRGGSGGQCFDLQNGATPANWADLMAVRTCFFAGWDSVGIIEGFNIGIASTLVEVLCTNGLEFKNCYTLGVNNWAWAQGLNAASSYALKISGTATNIGITGPNSFILGSNESAIWIDSGVTTSTILVNNNAIVGAGALFRSGGLNQASTGVRAFQNPGFEDSAFVFRPATSTNAAAPNNSVYYSSTSSRLVYKDAGGTVNLLY